MLRQPKPHSTTSLDLTLWRKALKLLREAPFSLNLSNKQAISLFEDVFLSGLVEQDEDEVDFEDRSLMMA
jgi:hypothetical protein